MTAAPAKPDLAAGAHPAPRRVACAQSEPDLSRESLCYNACPRQGPEAVHRSSGTDPVPKPNPRSRTRRPLPPTQATRAAGTHASAEQDLGRRWDVLGFVLCVLGGFCLVGLLFSGPNSLTHTASFLLLQGFGWPGFLLPLAFLASGAWLILRQFRRSLAPVDAGRATGVVLLYLDLCLSFQFFSHPRSWADSLAIAQQGQGGGLAGAALLQGLLGSLDWLGTLLVMLAVLLAGLLLTLRIPLPLFLQGAYHLGGAGVRVIRRARRAPLASLPSKLEPARGTPGPSSLPSEVTPGEAPPQASGAEAGPEMKPGVDQQETEILPREEPWPELPPWTLPEVSQLLNPGMEVAASDEFDRQRAQIIEETLSSFGAPARIVEVNRGPTITQFGVEPDFLEVRGGKRTRVKVSKISSLADDLALALAASSIRIQAPVPGKGYVGIEVPNAEISLVGLRDVVESETFQKMKAPLRFALGQDVSGHAVVGDLSAMPHLLIAGTTGSGKSVCVNSIVTCFLLHNTPDDLRLLMVDPKRVELTYYNGIPHLLAPVVVDLDRVVGALQWVTREMDERYHRFAEAGARNLDDYNRKAEASGQKRVPAWIVVIDELADLMLMAPDETERIITRLAQLSRATGIHLMIATQRPSVDVLTGLIKANFSARISFAVASSVDSRVILDQPGAEHLLGRGDMLFQAPDAAAPLRLQGAYVSEIELLRVVQFWQQAALARRAAEAQRERRGTLRPPAQGQESSAWEVSSSNLPLAQAPLWEEAEPATGEDELLEPAIHMVRQWRKASTTRLQRHFRIGYTRAARLMDALEERGIIGPPQPGAQPREVIDFGEAEEDEQPASPR